MQDARRAFAARAACSGRPPRVAGRPAGPDSARPGRRHPANGNNIFAMPRPFSARVRPILGELQRERGDLAGVVEEALSGIRAVKGFGAESILEQAVKRLKRPR